MSTPPPIVPATWYSVTAEDTNPECRNYETIWNIALVYSNADGAFNVVCGICGHPMQVLTYTMLDPQPVFD